MAIPKQKRNSLLRLSNEKKLRLTAIVNSCRTVYEKSLAFLEEHPSGATEETLKELEYEMIAWYKSGVIPPFVLVSTARYVIARVKVDFRRHWNGDIHPSEKFELGKNSAWKYFKVPKSNTIIDPFRSNIYVMGIGLMEFSQTIPDVDKISAIKFYSGRTPYLRVEYSGK